MIVAGSPTAFLYVETDVPEGTTLSEWRRRRDRTTRPSLRHRLLRTGR